MLFSEESCLRPDQQFAYCAYKYASSPLYRILYLLRKKHKQKKKKTFICLNQYQTDRVILSK